MKRQDQRGIIHILEIVIIAVIIIAIGVFIWWRMSGSKNSPTANAPTAQQIIADAACQNAVHDADLCKFFTSFKDQKYSTVTSTSTAADGTKSTSRYQSSGSNYHMTLSGSTNYETISIGQDIYIKGGDTWWKQTIPQTDISKYNLSTDSNVNFTEPTTNATTPEPTYKKIGTEACGNLTCFKYQIVDPANPGDTQYVWFDNSSYQLRRMRMQSSDGSSTDSTFDYSKVTISAPSPVQTLGPNQFIAPGQSQPVTMPSGSDIQSMMNSMSQ